MKHTMLNGKPLALLSALTLVTVPTWAQVAQTPALEPDDDATIVLSPFVVDAEQDKGSYQATSTLAGSRVRTDLKDVASSISVVTADFLRDVGATNNETLLTYTTNTEVGGVYGNYAGVGNTFIDGAGQSRDSFLRPSSNTRVRGLDSADNTRDFFKTEIPWDSYNVGRVDLQRGPNSILFGIGSPAGIINSSLNMASLGRNSGSFENRLGSFGSIRNSFDYNHVLLPDELAVRVALLDDDTKYRQKPAFNNDQRLFGALRYVPSFLDTGSSRTAIRANYEHGSVDANRPRTIPPWDHITPFFDPNGINRKTWDPYYAWESQAIGYPSNDPTQAVEPKNFWLVQYPGPGIQATANPMFIYDNPGAASHMFARQAAPTTYWGVGINDQGVPYRDASIDGFPYGSNIGIGSFNEYAYNHWRTNGDTVYPAADKGFYKRKSLTDTSIFDFYRNLIDGPNKREWQKWDAYNVALEQTFLNNQLGFELVYDAQEYEDGQVANLGTPYISVDIRSNLMVYPWAYSDLAVANPNAGRAFVGSSTRGGGYGNFTDRENVRFTAFGEWRAVDTLGNGFWSTLLGTHRLTGLYSKDTLERETRSWARYAVDSSWSDAIGNGTVDGGSGIGGLNNGDVVIDWVTYLSGDLRNVNSPAGLNLGRITAVQSPNGSVVIPYFDSRWNAPLVDPATPWLNPARNLDEGGEQSRESENPRNYLGWNNNRAFNVLNADEGDIDQLYTDISRIRQTTESTGLTWQGFLWDGTLVGTVGWRRDEQKLRSGSSTTTSEPGGVARPNPELDPLDPITGVAKGDSTTWGVVLHTPRRYRDVLPWGTNFSLTYSDGRNTRVENRYDFDGQPLPNAQGRTKDVGIVMTTLNDRLQFKVTHYKTTVSDANISSVTSETSTLGNNTYYLRSLEAWGTASALLNLAGRAGAAPGWEWYWNWAHIAEGWTAESASPTSPIFLNHPETAKQTAAINSWLSQLPDQSWFTAYGYPIDVTKAQAGDFAGAIAGWTPTAGVGGLQASGGGRINGVYPTGTVDNESEGYEFEIVGQPIQGLNLSINASKQKASQTALGQALVDYIEAAHAKYMSPAGDLRLWWGGDATVREYFNNNIWSAYLFQLETNGKMVSEMSPWKVNLVANYAFSNESALRGFNVGASYRWLDRTILGYRLNAEETNLDIDAPIWSDTQDYIDLWAGYERKLTEKVRWRIQLNLRNVGDDPHLIPYSVQPDGTPAGFRIQEGMTWTLTNTFSF